MTVDEKVGHWREFLRDGGRIDIMPLFANKLPLLAEKRYPNVSVTL